MIIIGIFKLSGNLYCLAHHPIGLLVSNVKLFKFRSLKCKIIAFSFPPCLHIHFQQIILMKNKRIQGFFFLSVGQLMPKKVHI